MLKIKILPNFIIYLFIFVRFVEDNIENLSEEPRQVPIWCKNLVIVVGERASLLGETACLVKIESQWDRASSKTC